MVNLPYSQSAENNKKPILKVIRQYLPGTGKVLEIGSGTGQHAVYFSEQISGLFWQTSDRIENHEAIGLWLDNFRCNNVGAPLELDVGVPEHWECITVSDGGKFDGVYSANTAHIMPWDRVVDMFQGVASVLKKSGRFLLYGPFNHCGEFTSSSNAWFDQQLRIQHPAMGIRDDREVIKVAKRQGLIMEASEDMPTNNRVLVFQRN